MHRIRIILDVILRVILRSIPRRNFLPVGALHPGRRARGRAVILIYPVPEAVALRARAGARDLPIAPAHRAERIGLTDQPREFGKRIAFVPSRGGLITAVIVTVIARKASILVSISHRDDAFPSGRPETRSLLTNQPLPNALTVHLCEQRSPNLPHLVRSMHAENGQARCQNRDDALNQSQPRLREHCIIIDNEA